MLGNRQFSWSAPLLPVALGLLVSFAALPAFGQQIHQLSYNGSTWADQNLEGAPVEWAVSSFFTTPNDQLHVFYGEAESGDLHRLGEFLPQRRGHLHRLR